MDTVKYKNIIIVDIPTQKFPTMVQLQKGPKRYGSLIGKKYISKDHAVMAIDKMAAENLISGGMNKAVAEMADLGLISPDEFRKGDGGIVEPHYPLTDLGI